MPFSFMDGGAVEHLLYSLISEKNTDIEITIFSSNPTKSNLIHDFKFSSNVKIIYFDTTSLIYKVKQIFDYISNNVFGYKGNTFSRKIKKHLIRNYKEYSEYDAVIVENKPEFIVPLKESGLKIPFILHLHNNYLNHYPDFYFRNYDHIITVSNYLTNECSNLGLSNVTTVQNGICLNEFNKIDFKKKFSGIKNIKVMFSGRLTREKGVHYLVEAISELNCDQIELYVCGDGPDKRFISYLKSYVNSETKNIRFTGKLNKTELIKYYEKCNVGVVPSVNKEAFGLSALEHLAAGNLVITTGVGGLIEVVSDDTSLIISPTEENIKEDLKKVFIELINNKELILVKGAEGRKAADKFSNASFTSGFFSTLDEISKRLRK